MTDCDKARETINPLELPMRNFASALASHLNHYFVSITAPTLRSTFSTQSTQSRPSGSREHGGSLLRQASQAQAGDHEFEQFRCLMRASVLAIAGDGQLGVDGKQSTKFGACLVEMAEMSVSGDFDQHRSGQARLVVQSAVGPFDRLFEAPRG